MAVGTKHVVHIGDLFPAVCGSISGGVRLLGPPVMTPSSSLGSTHPSLHPHTAHGPLGRSLSSTLRALKMKVLACNLQRMPNVGSAYSIRTSTSLSRSVLLILLDPPCSSFFGRGQNLAGANSLPLKLAYTMARIRTNCRAHVSLH